MLIIGGTLLTLVGLALLTKLFRGAGGEGFSQVGLIAFAVGFLLWIIDVSFRLSGDSWAAQETVRTGIMPDLYIPLRLWIGALFVIFTSAVRHVLSDIPTRRAGARAAASSIVCFVTRAITMS